MANENCLEGIKCPNCGHEARFDIQVVTTFTFNDAGADEHSGDLCFDDESDCQCKSCGHAGLVIDFKKEG